MITTIQVLLFFFMAFLGAMGAAGFLCAGLMQILAPIGWIAFGKMVCLSGAAVLSYWLWWKLNVLGCRGATERCLRRTSETQDRLMASWTVQIIIVMLGLGALLLMALQARELRRGLGAKPDKSGAATGSEALRPVTNPPSPPVSSRR